MQTIQRLALAAALFIVTSVFAADAPLVAPLSGEPDVLAAPDANAAWKPLAQMNNMEYLMDYLAANKNDRENAVRRLYLRMARSAIAFYEKYPQDPRRWLALRYMGDGAKQLANEDGTPKVPIEGVTWDPAVWVAWRKEVLARSEQAINAPDAPAEIRLEAETKQPGGLREIMAKAQRAVANKQPADLAPLKAELLRVAEKYPKVALGGQYLSLYLQLRTKSGAAKEELVPELTALLTHPSEPVRTTARKELDRLTALDKAVEISFTAVDGRKVDLKDLRGKVVLVDFWATWCGPCIAELPNVKRVYNTYHDKGFEVIGIALENARLKADDTPEQTREKMAQAQKVLTDFTTKREMPWPQYFDGKWWKNDISTRYNIASIPAMFLIDQEGRLVSTNARGPELEKEVKRLLKL